MQKKDNIKSILTYIPVFLPISPFIIFWQFLVLIYIIFDFALTVMVQCFPDDFLEDILHGYFDKILLPILILDILISMNRCIIRKGIIIYSRLQIIKQYVRSIYFVVDIISLLMSILQLSLNQLYNYNTAYNFIVFLKIIKVYQFDRNIKRYALKTFNKLLIYEIVKNIIFLALLNHVIGCFAYFIDYRLYIANYYPLDNPGAFWLLTSYSKTDILSQDFWIRYTYSFYFSTAILSGIAYGDLVPQNPWETFYICFVMLLPLVIYSYIFNAISNVIIKKRQKNRRVSKYIFQIKKYLKTLRLKSQLSNELITYLSFVLNISKFNLQFLDYIAPSTKKKYLVQSIHSKFDFYIFDQLLSITPLTSPYQFRDQLINIISQELFSDRSYLIAPPNRIKLYYINRGICKRVTLTKMKYSNQINRKQHACFYSFLTGIILEKVQYQTSSFVIAQSVDRIQFLELLNQKQFHQLKEAFHLMKQQKVIYKNDTVVGQNCLFCFSPGHILPECKHLNHKIVYREIIQQNRRKIFKRKKNKSKKIFQYVGQQRYEQNKHAKADIGLQFEGNFDESSKHYSKCFQIIKATRIYNPQYNLQAIY